MANQIIARKPITLAGHNVAAGDTVNIDLLPPGRLRQLVDHGYVYEAEGPTMHVADEVPPGSKDSGNGFACDICGKVLPTPDGVRIHQGRVHSKEE